MRMKNRLRKIHAPISRLFGCSTVCKGHSAFTLVELLVVIGMLAVLMGAMTTSISGARRRSQIAKATQDVKEITNAILAYQNYDQQKFKSTYATGAWTETAEGNLKMILGEETSSERNEKIPVLYNGQVRNGQIRDPWGKPYEFMIKKVENDSSNAGDTTLKFVTAPSLPNFYRLTDEERQ